MESNAKSYKTDKVFWHHYDDFYRSIFADLESEPERICEIGVYRGDSIVWLRDQFPNANIFAADIIPFQSDWPTSDKITYFQLNQANRDKLREFYENSQPDLIFEDGSHHPQHQAISLILGIEVLKKNTKGGVYILEDVHTSHPSHPSLKKKRSVFSLNRSTKSHFVGNCFTLLLALEHLKNTGQNLTPHIVDALARDSIFTPKDILLVGENLKKILLYRRTRLPDYCSGCGSQSFDYHKIKCVCGIEIFSSSDSMTFALFV